MPSGGEGAARAFYRGVLGLPEVPKPDHLAKRGGVWFERGSLKIHGGVDVEFKPALEAHPAFLPQYGVEAPLSRAAKRPGMTSSTQREETPSFKAEEQGNRLKGLRSVMTPWTDAIASAAKFTLAA